jgi:hypothetical protein
VSFSLPVLPVLPVFYPYEGQQVRFFFRAVFGHLVSIPPNFTGKDTLPNRQRLHSHKSP